jgi:hypothetical protein
MDGIKVEPDSDEMDPLSSRDETRLDDGRVSFTFVAVNNEPQVRLACFVVEYFEEFFVVSTI